MSTDTEALRLSLEHVRATNRDLVHQLELAKAEAEHWRLNFVAAGDECLRLRKLRQQVLSRIDAIPTEVAETAKALTPTTPAPLKLE